MNVNKKQNLIYHFKKLLCGFVKIFGTNLFKYSWTEEKHTQKID